MVRYNMNLEGLFKTFDSKNDGYLDYIEFD